MSSSSDSPLVTHPADGTDMPHTVPGTPTVAAPNTSASASASASSKQSRQLKGPERFLTEKARTSEADGIRGLLPLEGPGIVSFPDVPRGLSPALSWARQLTLSAGRPNPTTFPFEKITLSLKAPLADRLPGHSHASNGDASSGEQDVVIDGEDLDQALQYGPSAGLLKLRNLLTDIQERVHKRDKGGWQVSLGSGTQDLLYKKYDLTLQTFQVVCEPGDPVLCETPLYAGALPPLKKAHAELIEVGIDENGLSPVLLRKALEEWPEGKKRPRCVYTNPIGCNPSGCSSGRERKLEILEVCKEFDILIIEDDPYYFLTPDLIPSYFELEPLVIPSRGQVIRFDSFSKIFSGGMRLGYATGPTPIVHAIDVQTSAVNLHTSGVSQALAYALLKSWGVDGLLSHSKAVAQFYRQRGEWFEEIARTHLGDLADWVSPVAGMFLWIDLSKSGIKDTERLIKVEALAKGVLAVPGFAFYPSGRKSSHLRVSFSIIDQDETELGMQRLAEAIREKRDELRASGQS